MKKKLYITILFLGVLCFTATSQFELKDNHKDAIFMKVDEVLDDYAKYNTFSEDADKFSDRYAEMYKSLFADAQSYVYNDLESKDLEPEVVEVTKYTKMAKGWYSAGGLMVQIRNKEKYGIKHLDKKRKSYTIKVSFDKTLLGFFNDRERYEKTYNLIMTLEFDRKSNDFENFRIISVYDSQNEFWQIQRENQFDIGFSLNPGWGGISVKNPNTVNISSKDGLYYGVSLKGIYYYANIKDIKFGAGLGVGYSMYNSTFELDYLEQSDYQNVDVDGDTCLLNSKLTNLKEEISISFVDIPIYLFYIRHIKLLNKIEGYANIGICLSVPVSSEYTTSGNDITNGFYPEWGLLLEEIPYYGYEQSMYSVKKNDIELNPMNFGMSVAAGLSYPFNENLALDFGFEYLHGLTNILNYSSDYMIIDRGDYSSENEYSSLIGLAEEAKIRRLSFNIGLLYRF